MFSRTQPLGEQEWFFVFDIWSHSLKGIYAQLQNGKIKIIDSIIRRQQRKNMLSGEISDLMGVSQILEEAIVQLAKNSPQTNKVIFLLNSKVILSDSLWCNYVRDNPHAPITMEEIDYMVSQTEQRALNQIENKILERVDGAEADLRIVSTCLTSLTIDWQKLSNPIGFTGTNVKLQLVNIFAPHARVQALLSVARMNQLQVLSIIPAGVALGKIFEHQEVQPYSCAIVDIWYARTIVSSLFSSEFLSTQTLPFGAQQLENLFIKILPFASVVQVDAMMSELDRHVQQYETQIAPYFSTLFTLIAAAISDSRQDFVPRIIYFSGWIATTRFFRNSFEQWKKQSIAYSAIDMKILEASDLLGIQSPILFGAVMSFPEITMHQVDPLVSLLRSVIYRYE
jgi:hypothetical protein